MDGEIVVLFSAKLRPDADAAAYEALSARMAELVVSIPGFVGVREYDMPEGEEFAIVRFASQEALSEWRNHPEHREAQRRGREDFYESYRIEITESRRAAIFP
ncbi:MAG: antibiotic biosynthesis monooxygenase family protein [Actinomycetota bacterium]